MSKVNHNPKGLHSITPALTVHDAKGAIEFYKKAFGAIEKKISLDPAGKKVMHAEIKIGDSVIMLNDEFPEMGCVGPKTLGNTPITLNLQVEDVDQLVGQAVKAGATVIMPVADQFWGDRYGQISDPYGYKWGVSTHIKDLTEAEIKQGMEEWQKKQLAHAK